MGRVHIKPHVAAQIPPGTPVKQVAAALGVPYHVAYRFMVQNRIPRGRPGPNEATGPRNNILTRHGDELLADIHNPRLSLDDIGAKYGVTRERIRQIAVSEGIKRQNAASVRRKHRIGIANAVKDALKEQRKRVHLKRIRPWIAARDGGASWLAIGRKFGVSTMCAYRNVTHVRPDLREVGLRPGPRSASHKGPIVPQPKPVSIRPTKLPSVWECRYDAWEDAEIAKLRTYWSIGMSCSDIGRILRRSKNAIIGKVHRLGLKPREHIIRRAA